MQAVITYPESYVEALKAEAVGLRNQIEALELERSESTSWGAVSEARSVARHAQQELIDVRAELERTREELANQPSRRELGQLKAHTESLERKVAEQSAKIHELEKALEASAPTP